MKLGSGQGRRPAGSQYWKRISPDIGLWQGFPDGSALVRTDDGQGGEGPGSLIEAGRGTWRALAAQGWRRAHALDSLLAQGLRACKVPSRTLYLRVLW